MRGCWWVCAAALCVGCGSNVKLGGAPQQGADAGTQNNAGAGTLGSGGSGAGGTTGTDAGVAGNTGADAGTAGSSGSDSGVAGSGSCGPTVVAQSTFPTQYWDLALDANNVYWISFDSTGSSNAWLERAPKAGGKPQQIAAVSVAVEDLISSGADVLCATAADPGNGISSIDKNTGKLSTIVGNTAAHYVAANSTTVFYVADIPGGNQAGDELDMVARTGGQVITLSSVSLNAPYPDAAGPIALGNDVYWIKPGQPSTLERINLMTATVPSPIATGNFIGGGQHLALDNGKLFFLVANGTSALNGGVDLKSVSTSGGAQNMLVAGTNAGNVIADGGEVFFASHGTQVSGDPGYYQNDGTIQKVPASGGKPVTLVSGLPGGQGPSVPPIAVDATYLYWIQNAGTSGYRIMRTCR